MSDFNLVYWHRTTGKKMLAKRVMVGEYRLLDPATKHAFSLTKAALDKDYFWDKGNVDAGRARIRKHKNRLGKNGVHSKAFQNYLRGTA